MGLRFAEAAYEAAAAPKLAAGSEQTRSTNPTRCQPPICRRSVSARRRQLALIYPSDSGLAVSFCEEWRAVPCCRG